jgi:peroxiredoxin
MPSRRRTLSFPALLFSGLLAMSLVRPTQAGESPIGTKPPEWEVGDWINSKPLALKDLAGKVVLVRWWFGPGCPFCTATAPALNDFHIRYRERGLVVVGLYHHKSKAPLDLDKVKETVGKMGFRFPVAVDHDWKTLRAWWLDDRPRGWTSVSFLLDRKGVIRHVHPGGQYVEGDKAHAELRAKIEELLAEK